MFGEVIIKSGSSVGDGDVGLSLPTGCSTYSQHVVLSASSRADRVLTNERFISNIPLPSPQSLDWPSLQVISLLWNHALSESNVCNLAGPIPSSSKHDLDQRVLTAGMLPNPTHPQAQGFARFMVPHLLNRLSPLRLHPLASAKMQHQVPVQARELPVRASWGNHHFLQQDLAVSRLEGRGQG